MDFKKIVKILTSAAVRAITGATTATVMVASRLGTRAARTTRPVKLTCFFGIHAYLLSQMVKSFKFSYLLNYGLVWRFAERRNNQKDALILAMWKKYDSR